MAKITEEMALHKQWFKEAKDVTLETLPEFLTKLLNYEHDYGTICNALVAGGIATMWAMNKHPQGGIAGFQAGCIMWGFIKEWMHYHDQPLRMVHFKNMLYPQYENEFRQTITLATWEWLQEQAIEKLADGGGVSPEVKAHWQSVADGNIPFGYTVKEEE